MYTIKEFDYITSNKHQIEEHDESVIFHLYSFLRVFFLFTQCMRDDQMLVNRKEVLCLHKFRQF